MVLVRVFVEQNYRGDRIYRQKLYHIPGIGGHNLQQHSQVLVRPKGQTQDIPLTRYKVVRGAFDLKGCEVVICAEAAAQAFPRPRPLCWMCCRQ